MTIITTLPSKGEAPAEFGLVLIDVLRQRFRRTESSRLRILAELPHSNFVARLAHRGTDKTFL